MDIQIPKGVAKAPGSMIALRNVRSVISPNGYPSLFMSISLGRLLLAATQSVSRTQLRVSFQQPYEFTPSSRLGQLRHLHSSFVCRDRSFTNFLANDSPPAVQVESISDNGIQLADGLIIPGPCIFLEGKVFLWDVPGLDLSSRTAEEKWKNWDEKRFDLFEVVTPRPGK